MSQENSPAIHVISPGSSPRPRHTLSLQSDYDVAPYDAYSSSDLMGFGTPDHKHCPSLDTDIIDHRLRDISPLTSPSVYSSPHSASPLSPFMNTQSPSPQSNYSLDYSPSQSGGVASVSMSFNAINLNLGDSSSPSSATHYFGQPYSESSESLHREDISSYHSYASYEHEQLAHETPNSDDGPLGASESTWSSLLFHDDSYSTSEAEYHSSQDSGSQQSHLWQDQHNSVEHINSLSLTSRFPDTPDTPLSPWNSGPLDLPPPMGVALPLPTGQNIENATHLPMNVRRNRGHSVGSTSGMRAIETNNRSPSSKRTSPYPSPHAELHSYSWSQDPNMGSHLTVPAFALPGNPLTRRHSYTHSHRPTDGFTPEHRTTYPFKQEESSSFPSTIQPVHKKVASSASILASKARRTKEATFHCDLCPQAFTTNHNLMNHKNAHMGIKDFVCRRCSKPFTTQSVLARHMKTCKAPEPADSSPFSTGSRQ